MKNNVINVEVEIKAPAETVWSVLTDFANYAQWNPLMKSVEGEAKLNSQIKATIEAPGQKPINLKPKITTLIENEELAWRVRVVIPGILDMNHQHLIEKVSDDTVKYIQRETVTGLLSKSFLNKNKRNIEFAYTVINRALKSHCESKVNG